MLLRYNDRKNAYAHQFRATVVRTSTLQNFNIGQRLFAEFRLEAPNQHPTDAVLRSSRTMVLRTSPSEDNPPEVCKLYAAGKCRSGTKCKQLHEIVSEQVSVCRDFQFDSLTPLKSTNTQANGRASNQELKSVELSAASYAPLLSLYSKNPLGLTRLLLVVVPLRHHKEMMVL